MSNSDKLIDLKNVLYVDRIYSTLQVLRARDEIEWRRQVDLRMAELRLFSQNGEDGVLDAILRAIGVTSRFFVDFGVGDGWSCNCSLLAEVADWEGLFIETDEHDYQLLSERYRNSHNVACVKAAVTPESINDLFQKNSVPYDFGVLSIDIDGQDFWVWKALNKSYKPSVVVIEYNSAIEPSSIGVEVSGLPVGLPLSGIYGASLGAMKALGERKGYRLVHTEMAGVNVFFVREDLILDKGIEFTGIVTRSPNFGLRGRNHSDDVLYGSGLIQDRPQTKDVMK